MKLTKKLTRFKAVLGDLPRIRFRYDPQQTKKLQDGTIVSNKGVGFKYNIKLVNGQIYEFDMDDDATAFMVNNLGDKLQKIDEMEVDNTDIETQDTSINTDNKTVLKASPTKKTNRTVKQKEKPEKKVPTKKVKNTTTEGEDEPATSNKK